MRVKRAQKWVEWSLWRKIVFSVSIAILTLLFSYVALNRYEQHVLTKEMDDTITIPSDWNKTGEAFIGDRSCFAVCPGIQRSYSTNKKLDINQAIKILLTNVKLEHVSTGACYNSEEKRQSDGCSAYLSDENNRYYIAVNYKEQTSEIILSLKRNFYRIGLRK